MKISIVIPVYNAEPYINQCVSSLLKQTLQDFEIICVNDRSTDNSVDILKSFNDPRIIIIDNTEDKGAGSARNVGMKHANGDYISVLDADDFFDPQMLEILYNKATKENADVVVCGYHIFDDRKQKVCGTILPHTIKSGKPDDFGNDLLSMQSPNAWTKLYKASFIRKYDLQFDNVPYCNDMAFVYSSLFCASRIVTIPDPLIYYRYFTKTQASSNKPQDLSLLIKSLLTTRDKLVEQNLYKKYEKIFIEGIKSRFQHEIHAGMTHNKKEAVLSLKSIIPKEFFSKMFSSKVAVSLIVPVYNVEPFLKECLDSLINQTLKNIEIICVDDGSTDNSLSILREYESKDKRIKVIHQENKGLPIARNVATEVATGEYLQFVDSDDYLSNDACETLYMYAKLYDLEMLSFQAIEFDNKTGKEFISPYHSLRWVPQYFRPVFSWTHIKKHLASVAATACLTVYKRAFLEAHNIKWLNKKLCYEDTPFFTEALLSANRMGVLKERLYHRRVHPQSITQNKEAHFFDYLEIMFIALALVKEKAPEHLRDFVHLYLSSAFSQYRTFSYETKQKYTQHFTECIRRVVKEYCRFIPSDVCRWYKLHR